MYKIARVGLHHLKNRVCLVKGVAELSFFGVQFEVLVLPKL